jgi:hypothetical protein
MGKQNQIRPGPRQSRDAMIGAPMGGTCWMWRDIFQPCSGSARPERSAFIHHHSTKLTVEVEQVSNGSPSVSQPESECSQIFSVDLLEGHDNTLTALLPNSPKRNAVMSQ